MTETSSCETVSDSRGNAAETLTSQWIVTGQEVEMAHDWEQEVRCDWLIGWGGWGLVGVNEEMRDGADLFSRCIV